MQNGRTANQGDRKRSWFAVFQTNKLPQILKIYGKCYYKMPVNIKNLLLSFSHVCKSIERSRLNLEKRENNDKDKKTLFLFQ